MFALIHDRKVIEISITKFAVAPPLFWVATDQDIKIGCLYDGKKFANISNKKSLDAAKEIKLIELENFYKSLSLNSLKFNLGKVVVEVQNNSKTRDLFFRKIIELQTKINQLSSSDNISFCYRDLAGNSFDLSLEQLKEIALTLEDQRQIQFDKKEKRRLEIISLKTQEEVQNYSLEAGW